MRFTTRHKFTVLICGMAPALVGCLPDNALRTVLGEQILTTGSLITQGNTSLLFGLPDAILNGIVTQLIFSLLSGVTGV
jgi:uncharacterized protein YaaQ